MPLDQTGDRILNLKKLLARVVLHRQVKKQVAVHEIGLPSCLALARPYARELNSLPVQPLVERSRTFAKSLPSGSSPTSVAQG